MCVWSLVANGLDMRILILGGTSEARALAEHLSRDRRFDARISLAGRTRAPRGLPIPTRVGGFGGAAGLADYLKDEGIAAVIDATHPFATQISANAVDATDVTQIPLATLCRPAWEPESGDRWTTVPSAADAALAIGAQPRRVLLTMGRLEISVFGAAPQHSYVARSIDPVGDVPLPPSITFITARPPFDVDAERALMSDHRIDVIVSKNSGSSDTESKLVAARGLGLPVIMIARPHKRTGVTLGGVSEALCWLEEQLGRAV